MELPGRPGDSPDLTRGALKQGLVPRGGLSPAEARRPPYHPCPHSVLHLVIYIGNTEKKHELRGKTLKKTKGKSYLLMSLTPAARASFLFLRTLYSRMRKS